MKKLLILALLCSGCSIDIARPTYSRTEIDAMLNKIVQTDVNSFKAVEQGFGQFDGRLKALEPKPKATPKAAEKPAEEKE
jgi:hypothetical protein